jgi:fructose-bisphosphate aldolase, class II
VPVLVGVSEGEREFMGVRQVAALIESIRQEYNYPIFLNADHTHSLAKAAEAANAGFDSIMSDRSELPFAENGSETRAVVEAIRKINPSILVEGRSALSGVALKATPASHLHSLRCPSEVRPTPIRI